MISRSGLRDIAGVWTGEIALAGAALGISVVLRLQDEGWSGTLDIPQQGLRRAPLGDLRIEEGELAFCIPGLPGDPTFRGGLTGDGIRGTFVQAGRSFPFALVRSAAGEAARPPRPQEPEPPFPYAVEEVAYDGGGVTLAGSLTIPAATGPHPAVLLLSGSGAHNRDEEVFGHKPFLVLADHLTRAGIAVLRVDDRGVGGSSGKAGEATTAELADDALRGVRFLAGRPEIAAGRIGLLGHSEGALVASLAASRSDEVAFVHWLAGPGVPGRELLPRQNELILRARGIPEAVIRFHATVLAALIDPRADLVEGELPARLGEAAAAAKAGLPEAELKLAEALVEGLEKQLPRISSPWFRYFLDLDPGVALRRLEVPVLAIAGDLDLQVPPDQSFPEIEKALAEAATDDVTLRRFAGLNHLMQPATSGSPLEYAEIEQTIHPDVLELVSSWIADRFGRAGGQKMK